MTGNEGRRLLALVPASKRLGYAVIETPNFPLDFGLIDTRKYDEIQVVGRCVDLIEWNFPDTVLLENPETDGFRRAATTRHIILKVAAAASARKIVVSLVDKAALRNWAAGSGEYGKLGLCRAVASELPELQPKIPPLRRPWESEQYQMPMFEAFGMALALRDQA